MNKTNAKTQPVRKAALPVTGKKVIKQGNQRRRGHEYERECRSLMIAAGFLHVVTTRSESRNRDNDKIDLMNRNEMLNGRLPWDIQCKNWSERVDYPKILQEMTTYPDTMKVIFHQLTSNKNKKGEKKSVFNVLGAFAIMYKKDWLKMATDIRRYEELYGKLPAMPSPEMPDKRIQVSKKSI